MAVFAAVFRKRLVQNSFKKPRVPGNMRCVALATIDPSGFNSQVGAGKRFAVVVMAAAAQRLDRFCYKGRFGPLVRQMAYVALADLFRCVNGELLERFLRIPGFHLRGAGSFSCGQTGLGERGFQLSVTGQTQVRILRQNQVWQIRLVGVVTGTALTFDDRLMPADNLGEFFLRIGTVATGTQKSLLLRQHTRYVAAMEVVTAVTVPGPKRRMRHPGLRYLHQLLVAVRTQGRVLSIDLQQAGAPGPVGLMAGAAQTVPNRLMNVGLGKFDFGIDVTAVADGIQTIFHHGFEVGAVRVVATAAAAVSKRLVGNRHLRCRASFCMAAKADGLLFVSQQSWLRSRMISMAGQASLYFIDSLVWRFHFGLHLPMALITKRIAGNRKQ